VTSVAAWCKQSLGNKVKFRILNSGLESMLGVMAVIHTDVARNTQIKIWASSAGHKVLLGQLCELVSWL
jgi:hypothetical protein